mgnify:CR=1 FL=1
MNSPLQPLCCYAITFLYFLDNIRAVYSHEVFSKQIFPLDDAVLVAEFSIIRCIYP